MNKILRKVCSLLLCALLVCTPCVANASDIISTDSTALGTPDSAQYVACGHQGQISFLRRSPLQIDVVVKNHVVFELFGITCTDLMSYTIFYEILNDDGSVYASSNKAGLLGREETEIWSLYGRPGQKLRCRLVTNMHLQTDVGNWGEIYFTS